MDAPDADLPSTDLPSTDLPTVERSVELDAAVDDVLHALDDPGLLSTWLGAWTDEPDGPVVVTDDGVSRRITERSGDERTRTWTWHPVDDDGRHDGAPSTVTFVVTDTGDTTLLVVREQRRQRERRGAAFALAA